MTKKNLLVISGIADAVDVATGWIPGPWSIIVDVPVTIIHFMYAGPRALVVLLEYIPMLGLMPIYTIAAMSYPEKGHTEITVNPSPEPRRENRVMELELIPSERRSVPSSAQQRLEKLAELRQKSFITEAEYDAKKQEILRDI